tara:strand:- start:318 stop:731 length:414 start_codon:yes stop_codon:yes gene_type:complete
MNDCIFCKIVEGNAPSNKIYEDDNILAFLDVNPTVKGHALVIPKKHFETILDIDDETLKELIIVTKRVSKAIYDGLGLEGFSIGTNQFEIGGQVVPHLHIHIVPRNKEDGIENWPRKKYVSDDEKKEFQDKITRLLK